MLLLSLGAVAQTRAGAPHRAGPGRKRGKAGRACNPAPSTITAMAKFQYQVTKYSPSDVTGTHMQTELNFYGNQGWELMAVINAEASGLIVCVLKRMTP